MASPSQPLYIPPPFVGRQREQKAYRQLLTLSSPWLLIITGQGGNGKSTLLRQFATQTPPDRAIATLQFANEALRTDALNILDKLAEQLSPYCSEQKYELFETMLQEGRKQLAEISRTMSQAIYVGNDASLQGASLSMGGEGASVREQRLQIRAMVMKALYAQIRTLHRPFVLFLDTCEWLGELEGQEIGRWVFDELLPGIHERVQQTGQGCSAVIASRVMPSLSAIEKHEQWPLPLPMLEQTAVEEYLSTLGMQDALLRQRIYEITHGHALCVSIIGVLWQEQQEQPFTLADLPHLQEKFNERALLEFIQERLDQRLKPPFRELTRYGVLLRNFDLPFLQAVFSEYFSEADALDRFHQLIRYPYIEAIGNQHYAFHDLLRELQAVEIREQEPETWKRYHQRALAYLTPATQTPYPSDWYYHAIALDEEEGMSDWWNAVQNLHYTGTPYMRALFEVAFDETLQLNPLSQAQRAFLLGRFLYSSYGPYLDTALQSYEQALTLFRQVGDRLGEANVLQAMGDVQQFRDDRDAALQSYEQALTLFRQVGDRLGEANCYLAQGRVALKQEDYQNALTLHTEAYQLYRHIQASYSQARLLFYRSLVYEAMNDQKQAITDIEEALTIAQQLNLPFIDLLQNRLDDLQKGTP